MDSSLAVVRPEMVAKISSYAEVVVNAPLSRRSPSGSTFHYSIPSHLQGEIAPGQLVRVPFGPRPTQGLVLALCDTSPVEETRDIEEIAEQEPVLFPFQIELARWISGYYLAPLMDSLLLMLPPGLGRRARTIVEVASVGRDEPLSTEEEFVLDYLRCQGPTRLDLLRRRFATRDVSGVVQDLVERGLVSKRSELEESRVQRRRERVARVKGEVNEKVLASLKRTPKQRAMLEYLASRGQAPVSQLCQEVGGSRSTVQCLHAKGLIEIVEEEVWRDPLAGRAFVLTLPPCLTPGQAAAWGEIEKSIQAARRDVFLLHGVTGSGKTEIYLKAIEEALALGKQAIVLVPEIALTPQTLRRFGARFPERIAVVHSKLSLGERYDTWWRVKKGEVDIVIGSRSAIFAPLPRLGLIVMDEEHEWSYKQEKTPRYHAREVAVKLGELAYAVVVLGSATPDVVSYHRALEGEYRLLELPQRIMGHRKGWEEEQARLRKTDRKYIVQEVGEGCGEALYMDLPPVQVVDLRQELKAGNRGIFSRALVSAMEKVLEAGEQMILFLNRRGAATFIMCRDCGYVIKCPRCQVPLTYHSAGADLVCHHCNRRLPTPNVCPRCNSERIKYFGVGTQRVEEEVRRLFPRARIVRWDRDTTVRKGAHEEILRQFVEGHAEVMIGTQMVAKGLDLPLVTLVGVVTADTALHLPDFRAGERTFQLLTQVAGRAGRSILGGKVIVQTYTPEHYAIEAASRHDYRGFYRQEIAFRQQQGYPPYGRLVRLIRLGPSYARCQEEAMRLEHLLKQRVAELGVAGVDIVGPAPAFYGRLRGQFRWHLILRAQDPYPILEGITLPVGWRIDVDPVSVL